tara:strand:+ start:69 stop:341 length:273 start_codon:yes stop_codon:yes gene_type:complete
MNYENYKTLKSAGKASFSKKTKNIAGADVEYIALTESRFDIETGEALDDIVTENTLNDLEYQKSKIDEEITSLQNKSDGYAQAITDIKAL